MSLKIKFLIEIIIITLLLVLIPIIWNLFYIAPRSEVLSTNFRNFLNELMEIPQEATMPEDFIRGQSTIVWNVDDREVEVALDPDYQLPSEPVLMRVFLRPAELSNRQNNSINLIPAAIIKDQRANKAVQDLVTGSTVIFQQFANEPDGLKEISVSFTDTPGYFGGVHWNFERDKLPHGLGETFEQVDSENNFLNRISQIFQFKTTGILLSLFWILLPVIIAAPLAYALATETFLNPTLIKLNLFFIPSLAILYAVIFYFFFR